MISEPPSTAAQALRAKLFEIAGLALAIGVLFLVINWLHFQFLPVSVILYACILDTLAASAIVLGLYRFIWWKRTALVATEAGLTVIAANLLVLLYAVMGPTVIDRSLSIYIVQKVDMRGGEVAEAAMPAIFTDEYMPEFRLVDVRLTEQVTSGTLVIENGCISITPKGKLLSDFAGFYRKNFMPRKRVLMGEVTDQLTDPFRGTQPRVDVRCPER